VPETKQPVSHLFHIPIQITVAVFCAYWYWHVPAPNKAVLWLGGVAALMALVEMRPLHKAIYFLLVVTLIFTENRAIDKDRRDFAADESARRAIENTQFSNIGTAITNNVQKLLDKSDAQFTATTNQQSTQFAATMERFHANVNEITGGNSYATITPILIDMGTGEYPLTLNVKGKYAMADIIVEFRKLPIPDEGNVSDIAAYFKGIGVDSERIGNVGPTSGRYLNYRLSNLKKDEINEWSINIFARNRPTHEDLKVKWSNENKRWEYSFVVTEEMPLEGGRHSHVFLDKTEPEWHGTKLLPLQK
jgi:hypothetical protein